jgi:hypothetical protein
LLALLPSLAPGAESISEATEWWVGLVFYHGNIKPESGPQGTTIYKGSLLPAFHCDSKACEPAWDPKAVNARALGELPRVWKELVDPSWIVAKENRVWFDDYCGGATIDAQWIKNPDLVDSKGNTYPPSSRDYHFTLAVSGIETTWVPAVSTSAKDLPEATANIILKAFESAQVEEVGDRRRPQFDGIAEPPNRSDLSITELINEKDGERLDLVVYSRLQPGLAWLGDSSNRWKMLSQGYGFLRRGKGGTRFELKAFGIADNELRKGISTAIALGSFDAWGTRYGALAVYGYEDATCLLFNLKPNLEHEVRSLLDSGC